MKRILTYVVVALIAMAVGAIATSKWFDNREPEIRVEHDTIIIKQIDSVPFKVYDTIKLPPKTVIVKVPVLTPIGEPSGDTTQIETKKYEGREELSNGTIFWSVYADNLLGTDFKLETNETQITTTITQTLPPKSAFFIGGGVNYIGGNYSGLSAAELGLMYNRRQKWQIGVVVTQDLTGLLPSELRTSVGARAYFKL